jgi:protein required for attachment to host cells
MLQEIIQQVEAAIHRQMTEKFGLSREESARSADVFKEVLNKYFHFDLLNDPNLIQSTFDQLNKLQEPSFIHELRNQLAAALEEKAGLSPEIAAKVRDFSVTEIFQTIKKDVTDASGQLDIQKILGILNLEDIENTTRELFNSIGQRIANR